MAMSGLKPFSLFCRCVVALLCHCDRPTGNEPAALVNAVLGNIIGIFITPLWLSHFLSVSGAAPYGDVLIELTYTIIGPLIVGQLMQYLTPKVVSPCCL